MNATEARNKTTDNLFKSNPIILLIEKAIEEAVMKVNCYECNVEIRTPDIQAIKTYFTIQGYHVKAYLKNNGVRDLYLRWDVPV